MRRGPVFPEGETVLKTGDGLVVVLVVLGAVAVLAWRALGTGWMRQQPKGPVVDLLEAEGFDVVAGKVAIPVAVTVDDRTFDSRLYVDFLAKRDGKLYAVKVEKSRKTIPTTGAALRDALLASWLVVRPHGIVVVNRETGAMRIVTFAVRPRATGRWRYLAAMGFGAALAYIFLHG